MKVAPLEKVKEVDVTPVELIGKAKSTIKWAITQEDGAPNFEMRYISLSVGSTTPSHAHPWEHEVYVVKGEGFLRDKDSERKIKKDDFVFVSPNEKHQFINSSESESLDFICVVPKGTRYKS
ncbi:MAG: cupin domain-containing protein [Clostridia bacterium]